MAQKKVENLNFEEAMQELESIVEKMESGELALEDALKRFERGIALARASREKLDAAQQRVEILTSQNGEDLLRPLSEEQ